MSRLTAPHFDQLVPYTPGKPIEELERELGIEGAVKLASNESPVGPSPRVIEEMRRLVADMHRYPDAGCFATGWEGATNDGRRGFGAVGGNAVDTAAARGPSTDASRARGRHIRRLRLRGHPGRR